MIPSAPSSTAWRSSRVRRLLPVLLTLCLTAAPTWLIAEPAAPSSSAAAGTETWDAGTTAGAALGRPSEKAFDEIVKGAEKHEGLFTLYRVKKDLYAEIRPDQLDTPFFLLASRSTGLGERGFYFGDGVIKSAPVLLHRVDDQVELIQPNTGFSVPAGSALARSIRRSYADSVLAAFKVEAMHPVRKTLLVNLRCYFLTDFSNLAHRLNQSGPPGGFSFDAEKSHWGRIRTFPYNLELDVVLIFGTIQPGHFTAVPDIGGFPVTIHYSLAQLPPSDYRPRLADSRLGIDVLQVWDDSHPERESPWTRYIHRWNLKKQDPAAKLSPPLKPITIYLANTIPPEYRPAIRDGILMWNAAFRRIGIENAIEVRHQPDDADWDASDFRCSTVQWVSSIDAGYAAGGYTADPRTGEILRANIVVHANFVRAQYREETELVHPLGSSVQPAPEGDDPAHRCELESHLASEMAFGLTALAMGHRSAAGTGIGTAYERRKFIYQAMRYMAAHEMGHALGLGHNFHGSSMLPLRDLQNTAITHARGLSGSVMDYLPANLAPPGAAQGDYFPQVLGPYDLWAIEYAYAPIPAATVEEELPALRRIASRAAQPGLPYGSEEEMDPGPEPGAASVDPLIASWDLSSDPLGWAEQRMRLCRDLLRRLEQRVPAAEESFAETRRRFDRVLGTYLGLMLPVSRYVGGIYTSRCLPADLGAPPPLRPVPAAEQRRALRVIKSALLDADAFKFSPSFLNCLARDTEPQSEDDRHPTPPAPALYPLREKILTTQKQLLARFTHPVLLSRLSEEELRVAHPGETLTMAELFAWMTHTSWSEAEDPGQLRPIPPLRRDLQREHVNTMIGLMLQPAPGTPEQAPALAWSELTALRTRLVAALRSPSVAADAGTRAHLAEGAARIARALNARVAVPAP